MFDLEQAITEWRRELLAAGIKTGRHLNELESHLREEVEMQMRTGAGAEAAFNLAVQRIGQPVALHREFAKAKSAGRARWLRLKTALLSFLDVRPPALANFSPGVQEILENGRREAVDFHHDFIGTEHVLLGVLAGGDGVVPRVLHRMGVDHQQVRREIEKFVGLGPVPQSGAAYTLPRTPRTNAALKLAGAEARALKQSSISREHVFLGLLREGGGVAALVLKQLGVNLQTAREEIARELNRNQQSAS